MNLFLKTKFVTWLPVNVTKENAKAEFLQQRLSLNIIFQRPILRVTWSEVPIKIKKILSNP